MSISPTDALALLDWKRRIFALYAEVRENGNAPDAWATWRATRDELYRTHPQSPIPEDERADYAGPYFDYEPGFRVTASVRDSDPESFEIPTSGTDPMRFTRIGTAEFTLEGSTQSLDVFWLDAYAGGLFVPFRDTTSGQTTYGAGRYLLDTVKGSDLGSEGDSLVFDFNFAYNPSCAYDPRWVCPLAPPSNRLGIAIEAGEKAPAPKRD